MSISGISAIGADVRTLLDLNADSIREQISMAVLRQVQAQNRQQGEALVQMIRDSAPKPIVPSGTGQMVDISA